MIGRLLVLALGLVAALTLAAPFAAAVEPHGGMLLYPDVGPTHIAFRYANDLWLVPREGGVAVPLASPPGAESFPRFSPDGKTIAFSGNYDGGSDLYTIPAAGGVPFRVTHHPAREALTDWTPDGKLIFYAWGIKNEVRTSELFTVAAGGGLPEKLPVPYGENGAVSPDGTWLAYTPFSNDFENWKRYMGGRAPDIWLFNLKDHTSKRVTDWDGADSMPMWHGGKLYYISNEGSNHIMNVWVYDTATGERRQVTRHDDFDVKWPAVGPGDKGQGEIVYQHGAELVLLDLGTEKGRPVKVTIPGDRPKLRLKAVDESSNIADGDISATGKRAIVEARGDIWTLPAEKGSPVDLTRTPGVAERDPSWSPDGKWVAYSSDASGEYELTIRQSDGRGEEKRLTNDKRGFLYNPAWSPDSKKIAFWDQSGTLFVQDIDKGTTRLVHKIVGGGPGFTSWSGDSNWIAFTDAESVRQPSGIWLYNLTDDKEHMVTAGMFEDTWPTFDRAGKYLFFASLRDFSTPTYSDQGENWAYAQTDRLFLVPLTKDVASPFLPKSDDEEWDKEDGKDDGKDADKKDDKDKKDEKGKKKDEKADKKADKKKDDKDKDEGEEEDAKKEVEPVKIDIDGFEARAVMIPVDKDNFTNLAVGSDGKLLYQRNPPRHGEESSSSVHILDVDAEPDEMEKTVLEGTSGFVMSADGKKILAFKEGMKGAIVDAAEDQKWDKMVPTSGMSAEIDPREEWAEIFRDAWRIERDFFYDAHMHGVDWQKIKEKYEPMVAECTSREDLSYVIREMIAELNVGHAYYWGGDVEEGPTTSVGMLGCDYELSDGAYRIAKICQGGVWDADARGPLSQPGVDVKVGDYLLAVNGVPVDPAQDPWAAFQGLADRTVTLAVSAKPKLDDDARQVVVKLLGDESDLRYRTWIEAKRAYVAEKTDGRVGYIYVPDTGVNGQNDLVRQFNGQLDRGALIIDERWNGGGQIPTRFVELLNRPLASYWVERYAKEPFAWPYDAHYGPKCMLINESAGSGGDYFPYWFREAGVGKLVGTRTWGGLVGLGGDPGLIDGGWMSAPSFAFYNKDGTWGIEGHGVDPDIEVMDDPALMVNGGDPQLDAGIKLMLSELERNPYRPVPAPTPRDMSGMGIRPEDK